MKEGKIAQRPTQTMAKKTVAFVEPRKMSKKSTRHRKPIQIHIVLFAEVHEEMGQKIGFEEYRNNCNEEHGGARWRMPANLGPVASFAWGHFPNHWEKWYDFLTRRRCGFNS